MLLRCPCQYGNVCNRARGFLRDARSVAWTVFVSHLDKPDRCDAGSSAIVRILIESCQQCMSQRCFNFKQSSPARTSNHCSGHWHPLPQSISESPICNKTFRHLIPFTTKRRQFKTINCHKMLSAQHCVAYPTSTRQLPSRHSRPVVNIFWHALSSPTGLRRHTSTSRSRTIARSMVVRPSSEEETPNQLPSGE